MIKFQTLASATDLGVIDHCKELDSMPFVRSLNVRLDFVLTECMFTDHNKKHCFQMVWFRISISIQNSSNIIKKLRCIECA